MNTKIFSTLLELYYLPVGKHLWKGTFHRKTKSTLRPSCYTESIDVSANKRAHGGIAKLKGL